MNETIWQNQILWVYKVALKSAWLNVQCFIISFMKSDTIMKNIYSYSCISANH